MTWNIIVSKKSRKRSPSPPMKPISKSGSLNRLTESEDFSLMTSSFPRLPTKLRSYSGEVIDIPLDIPLRDEPVTASEQLSTLKEIIKKVDCMRAANEKSRLERINTILDDEINLIRIKDARRQGIRCALLNMNVTQMSPTETVSPKSSFFTRHSNSEIIFKILKLPQPGTALSYFSVWENISELLHDQKFADDFEADRENDLFHVRRFSANAPFERPGSTVRQCQESIKIMTQTPKMKKRRGRRVQLGLFR